MTRIKVTYTPSVSRPRVFIGVPAKVEDEGVLAKIAGML